MKKLLFLLLFTFGFLVYGEAQTIPRGMKYQAVARDLKGEILGNSKIELRIMLLSNKDGNKIQHYSELHSAATNQLGLFTLVVGEGKVESGYFDQVPWSEADIWMEIQIKANGQSEFTSISNSQLMAVPYAYHALTAGSMVKPVSSTTVQRGEDNTKCPCQEGLSEMKVLYLGPAPVTIKVYRKKELSELITTFSAVNNGDILTVSAAGFPDGKLRENTFFQVVSAGIPLAEIPSECEELKEPWEFSIGETFGNFSVLSHKDRRSGSECTVCDVKKEWHVGGNGLMDLCNMLGTKSYTDLIFITKNIERLRITKDGDININKGLEVGENLTVNKNVYLNTIGGSTFNNGPFSVNNLSPTYLTGSLTVDKLTNLTDGTESTSTTTGALVVAGGVGIGKRLNVGGMTKVWNNNQSNDVTDGALVVMGGAGIGKNLNVGGNTTLTGNVAVNGGNLTTTATTFNLLNTTATTVNAFGEASSLNMGGTTGIATLRNPTLVGVSTTQNLYNTVATNVNAFGAASSLNMGGTTGIATLRNPTLVGVSTTQNLYNTVAQTVFAFGEASSLSLGASTGSATINNSTVHIPNDAVVGGRLTIEGPSTNNTPILKVEDNNSGYLASFVNTNNGNGTDAGDGIKIQLGKERPLILNAFQLPEYGTIFPGITGAIKESIFKNGAFRTDLSAESFLTGVFNGATSDVASYANIAVAGLCNLSNKLIEQINTILPLQVPAIHIWDATTIFGGISFGELGSIPPLVIPALDIPAIPLVPAIPLISCPPMTNPFNWNLTFPTASSTPLTKNNEFVGFFDKNGVKVGAIRGQSLEDFIDMYTDIPHLVSVVSSFVIAFDVDFGIPDPKDFVNLGATAVNYIVNTWDKVGKMGIEYSSGSGDYAEWLERKNPNELIGTGDIVAVKGGKITKDLTGAEQIMAVSHHPIVLGNVPEKEMVDLGNNIAFMGQIPVKVMGPVQTGDYIVAKGDVQGYGIAVNPADMKVEDYKLAVGRSWTTNEKDGPKMVNTVVGVHNNNFLDLIKDLKEKAEENDKRLKAIEAKLNITTPVTNKVSATKAF